MTTRPTSPPIDPAAWCALREYLVDAYSNPDMRLLIERSLLAEAGSRLPDERVSAQEYATTLCSLLQRHSRVPSPEFWRQLAHDRPLRRREIGQLRALFPGSGRIDAEVDASRAGDIPGKGIYRYLLQGVATFVVVSAVVTTYCANAPIPSRPKIECKDGTRSPTCEEIRQGCCSGHGGPVAQDSPPRSR